MQTLLQTDSSHLAIGEGWSTHLRVSNGVPVTTFHNHSTECSIILYYVNTTNTLRKTDYTCNMSDYRVCIQKGGTEDVSDSRRFVRHCMIVLYTVYQYCIYNQMYMYTCKQCTLQLQTTLVTFEFSSATIHGIFVWMLVVVSPPPLPLSPSPAPCPPHTPPPPTPSLPGIPQTIMKEKEFEALVGLKYS